MLRFLLCICAGACVVAAYLEPARVTMRRYPHSKKHMAAYSLLIFYSVLAVMPL